MKKCTKCKLDKSLDSFPTDKSKIDAKYSQCFDCLKLKNKPPKTDGQKVCCRCKVEKDINMFHAMSRAYDGRQAKCIECASKALKSRKFPKLKIDSTCSLCKRKLPHSDFHACSVNKNGIASNCKVCERLRKYNLSLDEFTKLVIQQDKKCLICKKERKLVVDHDHKTGKIRGLLCYGCNGMLGTFEHDIEVFNRIKKYLYGIES